jgi:hypothetical protein
MTEYENYLVTKPSQREEKGIAAAVSDRAASEVKAMIFMARSYPRSPEESLQRIKRACERRGLAECAVYQYPRGGTKVTGPSIRLAEVIAQNWGNIDFGIREIAQYEGMSEVETYAWDLETNVRQTKVFKVPHFRYTKSGGYALEDPRDIYENVANQGARRLRACILGVIPGDIVDAAVAKSEDTLRRADTRSTTEVIRAMIDQFNTYGVTVKMIEARLGHKLNESTTRQELVGLGKIYNSIKDEMSKPGDWFNLKSGEGEDKEVPTLSEEGLKKVHAFNNLIQKYGMAADKDLVDFLKITAESANMSVDEIKAMAFDEQDKFFGKLKEWTAKRHPQDPKKNGATGSKPSVFDGPKAQPKTEPKQTVVEDDGPPPFEGQDEVAGSRDAGTEDEELAALYETDEWQELTMLHERYPKVYADNIAGSFKLSSLRSVQMALAKMSGLVKDLDDDIPM